MAATSFLRTAWLQMSGLPWALVPGPGCDKDPGSATGQTVSPQGMLASKGQDPLVSIIPESYVRGLFPAGIWIGYAGKLLVARDCSKYWLFGGESWWGQSAYPNQRAQTNENHEVENIQDPGDSATEILDTEFPH